MRLSARHRADLLRAALGQRLGGAVEAEILRRRGEGRQRPRQRARRPQAEHGDADEGAHQCHQPGRAREQRPRGAIDMARDHGAVGQLHADTGLDAA